MSGVRWTAFMWMEQVALSELSDGVQFSELGGVEYNI